MLDIRRAGESSDAEADQTLTEWGSWGRRCSAGARVGIRRKPFCLLSAQSPDSRSRETYTLQTIKTHASVEKHYNREFRFINTHGVLSKLFLTYLPACSPCRSHSIWCFQGSGFCWRTPCDQTQQHSSHMTRDLTWLLILNASSLFICSVASDLRLCSNGSELHFVLFFWHTCSIIDSILQHLHLYFSFCHVSCTALQASSVGVEQGGGNRCYHQHHATVTTVSSLCKLVWIKESTLLCLLFDSCFLVVPCSHVLLFIRPWSEASICITSTLDDPVPTLLKGSYI